MENLTSEEKKYLDFLNEVCNLSGMIYGMNDLMNRHKVQLNTSKVLQNAKMLVKENRGHKFQWTWQSIRPNIQMVRRLFSEWDELSNAHKAEQPTPAQTELVSVNINGIDLTGTIDQLRKLLKL